MVEDHTIRVGLIDEPLLGLRRAIVLQDDHVTRDSVDSDVCRSCSVKCGKDKSRISRLDVALLESPWSSGDDLGESQQRHPGRNHGLHGENVAMIDVMRFAWLDRLD